MQALSIIWTVDVALTAIGQVYMVYFHLMRAGIVQDLMGYLWKSGSEVCRK